MKTDRAADAVQIATRRRPTVVHNIITLPAAEAYLRRERPAG
ncbi:hypothetical protein ACLTEW_01505 [Gordonia lacunae]|nr:hypothetical protein [Gordonia lacunae]